MNAPSEDIKDLLEEPSSLGLAFKENLFVSEMPGSPDGCVVVYDTGGDDADAGYLYDRPSVQIRVRGAKGGYKDAYALALAIKGELHGATDHEINSTRYVGMWATGDILSLGYDDNHRPLFSVNFRLHRTDA